MGFRFHKRITIVPGVSINLGKKGASVSVGPRGAKMTFGKNGVKSSIGIPGTGIRYETPYTGKHNGAKCMSSGGGSYATVLLMILSVFVAALSRQFFIHGQSPASLFALLMGAILAVAFLIATIISDSKSGSGATGAVVGGYSAKKSARAIPATNRVSKEIAYIKELANASSFLFGFLRELNRSTRCRNQLKALPGMDNVGKDGNTFSINQRLAVIAYCDLRACFRKLGYDECRLCGLEGVGYAMMIILLIDKEFDLDRFLDHNQRVKLLNIVNDLSATAKVEMDVEGHEDEFRFSVVFGRINHEYELVQRYATCIYRWASLIAKADGMISEAESVALADIVKMRDSTSGDNVRISGGESNVSREIENSDVGLQVAPKEENPQTLVDVMRTLDDLVGLAPVKQDVKTLAKFIEIQRKRKRAGLREAPVSYHCVFTGNPGTGKTTVARILADIYREMGVVKKGHLVETDRSGLVAEYVGQTAVKTNKVIDSALDGVLFIDEAYTLVQGGDRDYGGEAIATLLKRMEDDRGRLVVILAGYTDEMRQFIDSNPGLQSRFSRYIQFPDYSAEELAQIFLLTAKKSQYVCDHDVIASIETIMEQAVAEKNKNFGNGRFVRNLFERAIQRQAVRLSTVAPLTTEMLSELTLHDLGFKYDD